MVAVRGDRGWWGSVGSGGSGEVGIGGQGA